MDSTDALSRFRYRERRLNNGLFYYLCIRDLDRHGLSATAELLVVEAIQENKSAHFSRSPYNFCRAMLCKRGLCCHALCVCLYVCASVTFVHFVKMNKHIFKLFLPSGSHTILVFPYQTAWQYCDGNLPPLNGGIECRWDRQKLRF